jgi:hypothetical protein
LVARAVTSVGLEEAVPGELEIGVERVGLAILSGLDRKSKNDANEQDDTAEHDPNLGEGLLWDPHYRIHGGRSKLKVLLAAGRTSVGVERKLQCFCHGILGQARAYI